MKNAKTSAGDIPTAGLTPLDLEQFRHGFLVFLNVLSGQAKVSPPSMTYLDTDAGRALPFEDTMFNRARLAAAKIFGDEVLRLSFYQRLELFGSLADDPKYEKYIGFCRPTLHLAFVAALARVSFSKEMTEKACIAAFDEELRRHLGEAEEDRAGKAGAPRCNRLRQPATQAVWAPSQNCAPSPWRSTRRASVSTHRQSAGDVAEENIARARANISKQQRIDPRVPPERAP